MAKPIGTGLSPAVIKTLNKHEAEIENIKKELISFKETTNSLLESQDTLIADDLELKKPGFQETYLYTYREIAIRHGVSVTRVQKVAAEKGLRRKITKLF